MARKKFILVTLVVKQEGDQWVGSCPELGTATYGDGMAEVRDLLVEAVVLHLNALEEVGECGRFLRERNIPLHDSPEEIAYRPPSIQESGITDPRFVPVPC